MPFVNYNHFLTKNLAPETARIIPERSCQILQETTHGTITYKQLLHHYLYKKGTSQIYELF